MMMLPSLASVILAGVTPSYTLQILNPLGSFSEYFTGSQREDTHDAAPLE
jgi:hypothetical protein